MIHILFTIFFEISTKIYKNARFFADVLHSCIVCKSEKRLDSGTSTS